MLLFLLLMLRTTSSQILQKGVCNERAIACNVRVNACNRLSIA